MKLYPILLTLLIAIGLTLGIVLAMTPPEAAKGTAHPKYATMSQGGTAERHDGKLALGWIYGGLQMALFVVCLLVSVRRGKLGRSWIGICGILYFLVFTGLMITYRNGVNEAPFLLGFPLPTAILVYGMWPVAAAFAGLYAVRFKEWIYSDEDAHRFEAIKAKYPNRGEN